MSRCSRLVTVGDVEEGTGAGKCQRKLIRRGAGKVYGEVKVWSIQAGRSWVRFPMVSLEFLIDISFRPLDRNEYQEYFLRGKGGRCTFMYRLS